MTCWNVKKVKSAIQKFFGAFCLINLSKTAIRGFVFSTYLSNRFLSTNLLGPNNSWPKPLVTHFSRLVLTNNWTNIFWIPTSVTRFGEILPQCQNFTSFRNMRVTKCLIAFQVRTPWPSCHISRQFLSAANGRAVLAITLIVVNVLYLFVHLTISLYLIYLTLSLSYQSLFICAFIPRSKQVLVLLFLRISQNHITKIE